MWLQSWAVSQLVRPGYSLLCLPVAAESVPNNYQLLSNTTVLHNNTTVLHSNTTVLHSNT